MMKANASLRAFGEVRLRALYQNIGRWVNSGEIIRLKNGLYVTKTHVDRSLHTRWFLELIANKLTSPSYLSLEYVLQKNSLLTEATYPVTSITLKTTRRFENKLGIFEYRHLHPGLYSDFEQHRYGSNIIYEATPAKALFDYLYLNLGRLDPRESSSLEEMRINWSELDPASFKALIQMIKKISVKKMTGMIPLLEEIHGNTRQRS
jgi:hypothetical protein